CPRKDPRHRDALRALRRGAAALRHRRPDRPVARAGALGHGRGARAMTFETPLLLAAAPIVGGVWLAGAWLARRRRLRAATAWSVALGNVARGRARWTPVFLALGGILTAIAFAGPRGGPRSVVSESRALDLIMAVDVSRSMLAEDVAPSRLQRAVREARRLVEDLPGDRLRPLALARQK